MIFFKKLIRFIKRKFRPSSVADLLSRPTWEEWDKIYDPDPSKLEENLKEFYKNITEMDAARFAVAQEVVKTGEPVAVKLHRWSGWPGAYCLDCGREDPWEFAVGCGYYDPMTEEWCQPPREPIPLEEVKKECMDLDAMACSGVRS